MKIPVYSETVRSRLKGLNMLPKHWRVTRGRFVMQVNPPAPRLRMLKTEDEVSFLPMEAVGEYGGLILDQTRSLADVSSGYTEFQDGDVVVAKITPCFENGKAALARGLVNGAAYGTTELHVLRAGPTLDRSFLFYVAISDRFRKLGESEMYGAGGQKRVPPEFNKDFPMTMPPLSEQQQIAAFLDWKTGQIDTLIAKKKELLEKLKEKRLATITQAVTRGLNPTAPLRDSGIPWLGKVPKHWEVKRLKFIFPRLFSGVSVNSDNSPSLDGSIAILKTSCVYGNRFNPEENKRVVETECERVACPVTRDSLVISRMNTPELVGNCGYVDRDYEYLFLPDRLWIAHFLNHPDGNGRFCWYFVISHAVSSLTAILATGTSGSMKNLTQESFLDIRVAVPPVSEQAKIAAFLDVEAKKLDDLEEKVLSAIEKLHKYRTALITSATTGKIDVRKVKIPNVESIQ